MDKRPTWRWLRFFLPLKETFVQCKGIQDTLGFWIPRRRFWIPGTGFRSSSVELGFRILIVCGIPDSLSCIADSKAQDSGFHKEEFPSFRIPQAIISRIPEPGFPFKGRSLTKTGKQFPEPFRSLSYLRCVKYAEIECFPQHNMTTFIFLNKQP